MTLGIDVNSWNETGLRDRLSILEKQKLTEALNKQYKEAFDHSAVKNKVVQLGGQIVVEDRMQIIIKILNRKIVLWPRSNTYFLEAKQKYGYNISALFQEIESFLVNHR